MLAASGEIAPREAVAAALLGLVQAACAQLDAEPGLAAEVESEALRKLMGHVDRGGRIESVAYVRRTVANCASSAFRARAIHRSRFVLLGDGDTEEFGASERDDTPELRLAAIRLAMAGVDSETRALLLASTAHRGLQQIVDADVADDVASGLPGAGTPAHARKVRERWDKRSQRARERLRHAAVEVVRERMRSALWLAGDELGLERAAVLGVVVPLCLGRLPPVAVGELVDAVFARLLDRDGEAALDRRAEVDCLVRRALDAACDELAAEGRE